MRGYLTLNPLKYTHPVLSLLIPIVFIALGGIGVPGGAVYVQTSFMTKRQKTIVSLAGPLTNVAFAAIVLLAMTALFYDPDAPGVLGRYGVLRLPSGDRGGAQPAAGAGPRRLRRAGTAPEPRNATRPCSRPKRGACSSCCVLFIASPLEHYFFARRHLVRRPLRRAERFLVGDGLRLTQFWSAWL